MMGGGSAVPASLIKAYAELDMEIIQGWGMTETSPIATMSRLDHNSRKLPPDERAAMVARQGTIVPFVDIRIVGDAGEAPWDGESVGEVQVRGPWITGSYHNLAKSEESFTADGWLKTGDVGFIGADGCLRLTDRAKDLIKSGGEWISSVDMENAIMGHAAVAEAAVIAVPHPKWDERPFAVVVLKKEQQATQEDIRQFLLQKYAKWQVPDAVVFVDAIPRTSTGKFLKTALRETYKGWKWA